MELKDNKLLLLLVLVMVVVVAGGKNKKIKKDGCHKAFDKVIKHLATKTPYEPKEVKTVTPKDCTAEQIWILNRHGTRNPGKNKIGQWSTILPTLKNEILNASLQGQGNLCAAELKRLESWQPDPSLTVSKQSQLVDQGYKELKGIGQRFQQRFPNLFPRQFSNETYSFRSTEEQRTIESGKSFVGAIFGENSNAYFPTPIVNDPILHFYESCDKWISTVDKNPEARKEPNKFIQSTVYLQMISDVQTRLLGSSGRSLTQDEVELMYNACAFETAWNPRIVSPWCGIFSKDDFQVLEYLEDLEDYWMDGYGFPVSYEQACTPVQDLLERFSARVHNNGDKTSTPTTVYFGHSGTLLKLYARLGLFKDKNGLTSDNFDKMKKERKWRSSKIGTFASNIAFVLFHCPREKKKFMIATLVQEKPVKIEACDDKWICPYQKFTKSFQQVADTCDLTKICSKK